MSFIKNNDDSQLILPSISTTTVRGWKRPERSTKDIRPSSLSKSNNRIDDDNGTDGDDDENESSPSSCQVCHQNQSRYVCPKCAIKYCSIECYQNHNNTTTINKNDDGSSTTSCTEEFYKKKVTSLLKLENIENNNQIRTMLNRYRNEEEDDEIDERHETNLEMENELYELLSKLEEMDDNVSYNELTKLIPHSLKEKFQTDLQNGTIQKIILHDWYPWWKKELTAIQGDDDDDNDDNAKQQQSSSVNDKTLDERFFEIPKFHTLSKKKTATQQIQQQELLLYNLIDILYATIYTLRLYHGVINACKNEPVEASMTLITTSTVLSKDTRYTSMSEVLVNYCTTTNPTRATTASPHDGLNTTSFNNHDWTVLVEDLAILITSHRLVGRALVEASDIFKSAIKELKRKTIDSSKPDALNNDDHHDNNINNEHKELLMNLRRLRKKIEFFLSWTLDSETQRFLMENGNVLKDDILAWRDDWKTLGTDNDDKINQKIESLEFPSSQQSPSQSTSLIRQVEPLMTEVTCRKK
jgi:hypothetical protein